MIIGDVFTDFVITLMHWAINDSPEDIYTCLGYAFFLYRTVVFFFIFQTFCDWNYRTKTWQKILVHLVQCFYVCDNLFASHFWVNCSYRSHIRKSKPQDIFELYEYYEAATGMTVIYLPQEKINELCWSKLSNICHPSKIEVPKETYLRHSWTVRCDIASPLSVDAVQNFLVLVKTERGMKKQFCSSDCQTRNKRKSSCRIGISWFCYDICWSWLVRTLFSRWKPVI